MKKVSPPKPTAIDLCCGVGGLTLGFEQAGFRVIGAVDADARNVSTHNLNFPSCVAKIAKLAEIEPKSILPHGTSSVDVVFGGPPCQGFSVIGKRDSRDPRSGVLLDFANFAVALKPRIILAENVGGLLMGSATRYLRRYCRILREGGYVVLEPWRLNAKNYGVPQSRERVFILAVSKGVKRPRKPEPEGEIAPTVWSAIGDLALLRSDMIDANGIYRGPLPPPSDYASKLRTSSGSSNSNVAELSACTRPAHTVNVVNRFRNTEPGSVETISRFPRLSKSGVSPTLRAGTGPDRGSYMAVRPIHPTEDRCLTVREAARLQGFPDWFHFDSTKWHGFRQIGNAVPPPLARAVAFRVMEALSIGRR